MRLYLVAVAIIVGLAVFSYIAVPRGGTQFQRCEASYIGQEGCIEHAAMQAQNASMCSYLSQSDADNCYYSIGLNSTNSTICSKINETRLEAACFYTMATKLNNYLLCSNINDTFKSNCLYDFAISSSNQTYCSAITNQSVRTDCYSTTYFNEALSAKNPADCSSISSNDNTSVTLQVYQNQALHTNDSFESYLNELLDYSTFGNVTLGARDFCYISLAEYTQNRSICTNVANGTIGNICTIASETQTKKANETVVNYTALQNTCESQGLSGASCTDTVNYLRAIETKNVSLCKGMSQDYQFQCYSSIGQLTNDSADCNYINNKTFRSDCLLNFEYNATNNTAVS